MLIWSAVVAAAVVVILVWSLRHRVAASRIDALLDKRRATSRLVSSGEFVDGNRRMKVALALTNADLFYENADMAASLDLRWVREVEYDTSLATGRAIAGGKVLRIRSFSQAFEFVLPEDVASRWQVTLPPRHQQETPAGSELAARVAVAT